MSEAEQGAPANGNVDHYKVLVGALLRVNQIHITAGMLPAETIQANAVALATIICNAAPDPATKDALKKQAARALNDAVDKLYGEVEALRVLESLDP